MSGENHFRLCSVSSAKWALLEYHWIDNLLIILIIFTRHQTWAAHCWRKFVASHKNIWMSELHMFRWKPPQPLANIGQKQSLRWHDYSQVGGGERNKENELIIDRNTLTVDWALSWLYGICSQRRLLLLLISYRLDMIFKDCKDASCAGKKKEELEDKFR